MLPLEAPPTKVGVCPRCAVKACAVRPVFCTCGRQGSRRQQIQAAAQAAIKQNASPETQSEAPRGRWKPGPEQHPGPENQDSQHMLNQPRGSFPEKGCLGRGLLLQEGPRSRDYTDFEGSGNCREGSETNVEKRLRSQRCGICNGKS